VVELLVALAVVGLALVVWRLRRRAPGEAEVEPKRAPTTAEVLERARREMEASDEIVAREAWRTYAYTVTTGFEGARRDFDFEVWLRETAEDEHPELRRLRSGLEERRMAEARHPDLEALVARYRREVFKHARPRRVQLHLAEARSLPREGGGELRLEAGNYAGELRGTFDNAQDAVLEGWSLELELEDAGGRRLCITSRRSATSFFEELLDSRHDAGRARFEEAPAELAQAFALRPFVGPVVAFGDGWARCTPRLDGEPIELRGSQLLSGLLAHAPEEPGEESRLAVLLYELELADGDEEDEEAPPFVTTVPLSRLLLEVGEDDVDEVVARVVGR